jgi:hypothetical protein
MANPKGEEPMNEAKPFFGYRPGRSALDAGRASPGELLGLLCVRCVDGAAVSASAVREVADDAIVHCRTEREAEEVRNAIPRRAVRAPSGFNAPFTAQQNVEEMRK